MSQSRTLLNHSCKSYSAIFLLTICAFLAQCVLTTSSDKQYTEAALHKHHEYSQLEKRPAFFVGSRYGRSSGNTAPATGGAWTSKTRRLIIVPRNDRFFLGSRYGKRSNEYLSPYEQSSLGLDSINASPRYSTSSDTKESKTRTEPIPTEMTMTTISCTYTGISNFYRCSNNNWWGCSQHYYEP
ncbi:RYamide neuropeptides isoform X2 [Drosophila busckii]|uniref:RYamide neuropeptides isoform X2 n=1 Tax=Drosophila busckii TaxID=30019 RepID=UPI001432DFCB|nr:RYamide neuropeptides isoform X2 [Drosophila busckii]